MSLNHIAKKHPIETAFIAGVIHSIILIASFPPFSYWGCSFLAPIPLIALIHILKKRKFLISLACGAGSSLFWASTHYWVADVSSLGAIPLIIHLALYTIIFVWIASVLYHRFGHRLIILPLVWVGVEFFRGSLIWGGYPWYFISHPLIESPKSVLAMPAKIGGVYLISFLTIWYSALLFSAVVQRNQGYRLKYGTYAGFVFSLWIIIGAILIPSEQQSSSPITVGIVQPDVPQDNRSDWTVRQRMRDWFTLRDITIASATDPKLAGRLDLIIWPEGFVPGWTLDPISLEIEREAKLGWNMKLEDPNDVPDLNYFEPRVRATQIVDDLLELQLILGTPLLVGSVAYDNLQIIDTESGIQYQRDKMYNSVFVIENGSPHPIWYDKMHLTPFGEVMPVISKWDWLEQSLLSFGAEGMEFALSPGENYQTVSFQPQDPTSERIELATPICFEATISRVCRKLVYSNGQRQSGILVNMTNDGWFNSSQAARETHLQLARWRCIELATPMIRSANTGVSCIIDRSGQVQSREITPIDHDRPNEGFINDFVHPATGVTLYARIGDSCGWICFGIMSFALVKMNFFDSKTVSSDDTES